MSTMHDFTIGHLFGGSGLGALGMQQAAASLDGHAARFRTLGGVDVDPLGCEDFERLTGAPALCADLAALTPAELRAAWGPRAPDAIFTSPPCKGFSRLLGKKAAASLEYQRLNELVLKGLFLACETWEEPPALIILENVPGILSRGQKLLERARKLLHAYGFVTHASTHDCGEDGGLAQHRQRFTLIARRPSACPAFVFRPPAQRVKGCGEVLGGLPLPDDERAGPLHRSPRVEWLNLVRLALIPAGGDWRDLPRRGEVSLDGRVREALANPLADGQARREVYRRFHVADWAQPAPTVSGPGNPGPYGVADPRALERLGLGATADGAGGFKGRPGLMRVGPWGEPLPTVTGTMAVSGGNGTAAVADPRALERLGLGCQVRGGFYGVLRWDEAAGTVTGSASIDNGRAAVADPREVDGRAVITLGLALELLAQGWEPPRGTLAPAIVAADGSWHRPLTTLELAVLQALPPRLGDGPLVLSGRSTGAWRERVGNGVPVAAARAWGSSMLQALLASRLGTWQLGSTDLWVAPDVGEVAA